MAPEMDDGVVSSQAEAARMLVAPLSGMVLQHAPNGDRSAAATASKCAIQGPEWVTNASPAGRADGEATPVFA
jgi:hypothetical protein